MLLKDKYYLKKTQDSNTSSKTNSDYVNDYSPGYFRLKTQIFLGERL